MLKSDLGLPGRNPPRARGGCWCFGLGLLLLLGAIGALGGGAFWYLRQQQDQARAESTPPQVLVTNPSSGKTIPAGTVETVSATILGGKPIVRAELWLDGNLKSADSSSSPRGDSPLYANFDLPVPNGPHQIFVRGIDTAGSIGQSLPVSIIGGPKPDKVFLSVPVNPGEKLADLASKYSTNPATLAKLNPNLGGNEPVAGSRVIVPAQPAPPPASSDTAPPDQPPSNTPVTMPDAPPLQTADSSLLTLDGLKLAAILHRPAAPTDLQGQMDNCNIKLRWNDNADNEERNDVWMTGAAGTPRVIASLKPGKGGVVWAVITAPEAGNLNLWVEAVNVIGGQPSNIISLAVESKCAPPPTKLQIEALEISASGGYDRTYCYVSLQGTPEIRIPEETHQFIRVKQGSTPSADLPAKKFVMPVPSNGALDISGECWGWSGKTLDKLGTFSRKFASDTWNGKPQELSGTNFKIALVFTRQGEPDGDGSRVIFDLPGGEDPSIPPPYEVTENKTGNSGIAAGPFGAILPESLDRILTWKWDGDPKKIDGFKVYLNDVPYTVVGVTPFSPEPRQVSVKLPMRCGSRISWRMTAYKGGAESKKSDQSAENTYWQPDCDNYLMVKFNKIYVHPTPSSSMCSWDDITYSLRVNETTAQFGGGVPSGSEGSVMISTGKWWCDAEHTFQSLGSSSSIPWRDTIVVPIPKKDIQAHISFTARSNPGPFSPGTFEGVQIYYAWDSASLAASELGCGITASVQPNEHTDYSNAPTYIGAPPGSGSGPFGLRKALGGNAVDLNYSMMVFPANEKCQMKDPPYVPKDWCPFGGVWCVPVRVPTDPNNSGSYRYPNGP